MIDTLDKMRTVVCFLTQYFIEIALWSEFTLSHSKGSGKKLGSIPPSLMIEWFKRKLNTQNDTWPFCGNTIWHLAILWKHKMPQVPFLVFCVSNLFAVAILCFHKMALCQFVFPQLLCDVCQCDIVCFCFYICFKIV